MSSRHVLLWAAGRRGAGMVGGSGAPWVARAQIRAPEAANWWRVAWVAAPSWLAAGPAGGVGSWVVTCSRLLHALIASPVRTRPPCPRSRHLAPRWRRGRAPRVDGRAGMVAARTTNFDDPGARWSTSGASARRAGRGRTRPDARQVGAADQPASRVGRWRRFRAVGGGRAGGVGLGGRWGHVGIARILRLSRMQHVHPSISALQKHVH